MRNQSSFHTKLSTEEQHYLKNNVFIRETLKTKKPCILNGCRAFWARNLECFPALLTKIQMPKTKGCHDGQPFRLFFSCGSFISGWCFTFWFCVRRCFRIFFFCRIFFLCIVGIICRIVLASCGSRCCCSGLRRSIMPSHLGRIRTADRCQCRFNVWFGHLQQSTYKSSSSSSIRSSELRMRWRACCSAPRPRTA